MAIVFATSLYNILQSAMGLKSPKLPGLLDLGMSAIKVEFKLPSILSLSLISATILRISSPKISKKEKNNSMIHPSLLEV